MRGLPAFSAVSDNTANSAGNPASSENMADARAITCRAKAEKHVANCVKVAENYEYLKAPCGS
ncbi:MAG: hypothetical protein GX872_00550 [Firmicutes bacterium]|nr:hypothetical protein [Bacillota bacterium]